MDLARILFAALVLVAGLLGGLPPLGRNASLSPRGLALANAWAAGLFLGIALIHMMPEAEAEWRVLVPGYPMAPLLAATAFLLILFFEHVPLSPHEHGVIEGIEHGRGELAAELGAHANRSGGWVYTLLVALLVHSLLSGLALGSQSNLAAALPIFVAIVAHKTTEGLALGVSLARNAVPSRQAVGLVLLWGLSTPVGILAGGAATTFSGPGGQLFSATCLALAAGTFISIAALDIIAEEFTHGGDRFAKWWLALGGLATAAVLALWI